MEPVAYRNACTTLVFLLAAIVLVVACEPTEPSATRRSVTRAGRMEIEVRTPESAAKE
jgi:hypothetical protein